tara:strand:+ start:513 stop:692 length:180 start_codon:yes stop_codon:yes gene_type:complete
MASRASTNIAPSSPEYAESNSYATNEHASDAAELGCQGAELQLQLCSSKPLVVCNLLMA